MNRKILLATLIFWAIPALAQQGSSAMPTTPDIAAMEQRMKEMEERIIQLEGKVRMLQSTQPAPAAAPAATAAPTEAPAQSQPEQVTATSAPPPSYGGAGGSAAKALNPDISVIGDFIASAGA